MCVCVCVVLGVINRFGITVVNQMICAITIHNTVEPLYYRRIGTTENVLNREVSLLWRLNYVYSRVSFGTRNGVLDTEYSRKDLIAVGRGTGNKEFLLDGGSDFGLVI